MRLIDIAAMPDYNPAANTTGKDDHSVTHLNVYFNPKFRHGIVQGPSCVDHGAMNAVNPQRTIYRCNADGRGAYAVR